WGTDLAEPIGAFGQQRRDIGDRLDVADHRRWRAEVIGFGHDRARRLFGTWTEVVDTVTERWRDARKWWTAVEHFQQCGLFAEQILRRSGRDAEGHVLAPAGLVAFGHGALYSFPFAAERALQCDDGTVGANGERRDQRTLDDGVGIGAQQCAVLERARLTF